VFNEPFLPHAQHELLSFVVSLNSRGTRQAGFTLPRTGFGSNMITLVNNRIDCGFQLQ
jgi:hypothetical protein